MLYNFLYVFGFNAVNPENGVSLLTIKMEANAKWTLPATEKEVTRTLYFHKGDQLHIGEQAIPEYHLIEVNPSQELILENGNQKSFLLILQGKAIKEHVVQYDPFVMNTSQEIQEAFAEYRETQFGGWPWEMQEQVHAKDLGKFENDLLSPTSD